jgi:hypothetical protein
MSPTDEKKRISIDDVPSLKDFMKNNGHHKQSEVQPDEDISQLPEYLHVAREENKNKKYFIETHGC